MNKASVIFPAYNEEGNIRACVSNAHNTLNRILRSFEIIIVNDGSTDSTAKICHELQNEFDKVKVISKKKNEGYGYALRDGIKSASFDLVFFSDADMQFDMRELSGLLEYIDDYEAVVGYREKRSDPVLRKITAAIYGMIARRIFKVSVKDINCAFKLFHKRIFDKVQITSKDYVVNLEIFVKMHKLGLRVKEVPVSHFRRMQGKSKVRLWDIIRTVKGIWRLSKSEKIYPGK